MNQPEYILPNGTPVRTHPHLGTTRGMENVNGHNLRRRRGNAPGVVLYPVPGMGGDVYWVQHGEGDTAPYCFTEFELVEAATAPDHSHVATINDGPLKSIRYTMATSARDWSTYRSDAWLYAIAVGWGDALPEVAAKHGWSDAVLARLGRLRAEYERIERDTEDR